jgi:microcompartment protein CcmL/EutN
MAMTCLAICGINHQAKVMSVTVAFASGFRIATRFGELVSNESLSNEEEPVDAFFS